MSTFTSSPPGTDGDTDTAASRPHSKSEPRRSLKIRSRTGEDLVRKHHALQVAGRGVRKPQRSIPPIGAMLARPLLLTLWVLIGGIVGFAVWGGKGYQATATVEFTSGGNDVALVQLEGESLAQKITTEPVIQRAATSIGQPVDELGEHVTATWQPQSLMVGVTAVATNGEDAVARANAVAQAAVGVVSDAVDQRLQAASSSANSMLLDQALADPDAELARRSQLGTSLGERQSSLGAESQSVYVSKAAHDAKPAGLTRSLSTAIGLAAGLFAGCLIAVLLGARGLRASSMGAVRRLAPGVEVHTPSEAPQVAARMVEGDESYLAVVVTRRASNVADVFTANLERILRAHGKTVTIVHPAATVDDETAPLLRVDAPDHVGDLVGTDVLVVVLDAGTESAAMLEGQSGFRMVILMRRFRTPVSDGLRAARAYGQATPTLVLGK
jgi:hypothetical protein